MAAVLLHTLALEVLLWAAEAVALMMIQRHMLLLRTPA
jgi:hypothetical protein